MKNLKIIKVLLSVLFILCLLDMPYCFFMVVRVLGAIGFVMLALDSTRKNNMNLFIIYSLLAISFQPIVKITFGRIGWNVLDVLVSIFLIATIIYPQLEDHIKGKKVD